MHGSLVAVEMCLPTLVSAHNTVLLHASQLLVPSANTVYRQTCNSMHFEPSFKRLMIKRCMHSICLVGLGSNAYPARCWLRQLQCN
jgi:hypothetical protein